MKIWLTLPYDPDGIKEVEAIGTPTGEWLCFKQNGFTHGWSHYPEGVCWHKSKKAAIATALKHRQEWVRKVTAEAARVCALPPLAAQS